MKKMVTALILNWNGKEYLEPCIASLEAQTYPHLNILVVDNASEDGSADRLEHEHPGLRLITNDTNLGFGGGNNVGIQAIDTPYILMVNNDTTLDSHCVERLVAGIEKDPTYGACATKIVLNSLRTHIDAAGIVVCTDGMSVGRGRMEPVENLMEPCEIFFASDCCCLYRKEMLDDIGLYDADFFAYDEETDLGWRAQLRGWKSWYVPDAMVLHHHSASTGSVSPFKAYLVERNRVWLALKIFPLPILVHGLFFTFMRFFWQAYGAFSGTGRAGDFTKENSKMALVKILFRAYRDAAKGLPRVMKQRRQIQHGSKLSTKDMYRILHQYGVSAKALALKS